MQPPFTFLWEIESYFHESVQQLLQADTFSLLESVHHNFLLSLESNHFHGIQLAFPLNQF